MESGSSRRTITAAFAATLHLVCRQRWLTPPAVTPSGTTIEATICARQGWQETGVVLERGRQLTITAVEGRWFEDPPGTWHNASGGPDPWVCSDPTCNEPMKIFPKYALIGQIEGDRTLLPVGAQLSFTTLAGGPLHLRPNMAMRICRFINPTAP